MPELTPRLVVRDSAGSDREVPIVRTPFTLGRQSDNDLVLLDNRISRRHAQIVQDGEQFVLKDAGSRHGTFVNGKRIETCVLKHDDQISLGAIDAYQITFLTEEPVLPTLLEKFERLSSGVSGAPGTQLQRLGLLLQTAQILHRAPALEEVLTQLVDSALQLTDAERGLLFLKDDEGNLQLRIARGRGGVSLATSLLDYSKNVLERVVATGREEVAVEDEHTGRSPLETGVIRAAAREIVAVPLQKLPMMELNFETLVRITPELLGVLYLDNRAGATSLTGLDRQVLATFALEGATVIENARLFRKTREQERIQHELSLAQNIQQSLLPQVLPEGKYFKLHPFTVPSRTVGGDYYDIINLPDDRFGIAVGDVSGKGLPAAMMAMTLQGAFAAVASGAPDLHALVCRINDFLCARTPPEMYATLFYGVIDPSGDFNFVSCGHPPSILLRADGKVEQLDSPNFPIGLFPAAPFTVDSVKLEPGDFLLVFSDGVTEAQNEFAELFGDERLRAALEGGNRLGCEALCGKIIAAIKQFVGGAPQADDLTLIVLRYGQS